MRPACTEIIICTGLRTRGGQQLWGGGRRAPVRPQAAQLSGAPRRRPAGTRPLRSPRPHHSRTSPAHALRSRWLPCARAPTTHHRGTTLRSGAEPPFIREARRPPCTTSTASTPGNTPSPPPCARTRGSSAQRPSAASSTPARSGIATTPSTRWARRSASSPRASPPTASSSPTRASASTGLARRASPVGASSRAGERRTSRSAAHVGPGNRLYPAMRSAHACMTGRRFSSRSSRA